MIPWKKPTFVELCMNAEIGAYQEDTGDEREMPTSLPERTEGAVVGLLTALPDCAREHVA
jgi:hypothetical protein